MTREVRYRYVDPLAQIWVGAARRIGLAVERTPDAYAATDGRGVLAIAVDRDLDADDSVAQMVFHELCHSLVEGEDSFRRADWGMDNTSERDDWRERACLRVQWVLTGRHGLRTLFAPTTEFRAFWDTLSGDVLVDRAARSVQAAIVALRRAATPPWAPALDEALAATARIARDAARFAGDPKPGELPALWTGIVDATGHPSGLPPGQARGTCGDCAWRYTQRGASRCRQVDATNARSSAIDDTWPACERFEAALDCLTCGACCRAAYHSVEVRPRDPVVKAQPSYVVDRGTYLEIRRRDDRCAALEGGDVDGERVTPYRCAIYDDRPRTCRDFTLGSAHCLTARRRVGLSL